MSSPKLHTANKYIDHCLLIIDCSVLTESSTASTDIYSLTEVIPDNLVSAHSLTQGQVQHDLLLRHTLSPHQSVHGADEPGDDVPGELHQPHQGPYAAPGGLLTGAHPEALGQPQINGKQEPQRDDEHRLAQTDGEVLALRPGGEVRAAGGPAAGTALRRHPASTRHSAAAIPSGRW